MSTVLTLSEIIENDSAFIRKSFELLNEIIPLAEPLSDKSCLKYAESLYQYLEEFEIYNQLANFDYSKTEDINFQAIFQNYLKTTTVGLSKGTKTRICTIVDGEQIPYKDILQYADRFILRDCIPCMKIVPTLIIDNACKYVPAVGEIEISTKEEDGYLYISVSNFGPTLSREERDTLREKGVRGKHAIQTGLKGNGLGLALADMIIGLQRHWKDTEMDIHPSEEVSFMLDGVPYSKFKVTIAHPQTERSSPNSININDSFKENLWEFIQHEYIRLNPNLCKQAVALFNRSRAKDNYSPELSDLCYRLKDLTINQILTYICRTNAIKKDMLNTNMCIPYTSKSTKRFSRQIEDEIKYLIDVQSSEVSLTESEHGFTFPTYAPITDILVHKLSQFILEHSNKQIIVRSDTNGMEIATDAEGDEIAIEESIKDLLRLHGMDILGHNASTIFISKTNDHEL